MMLIGYQGRFLGQFMSVALCCFPLLLSLKINASSNVSEQPKIIYGEDNRLEPYQVSQPKIFELSRSVAAMIPKTNVTIATTGTGSSGGWWWGGGRRPSPNSGTATIKSPNLAAYLQNRACTGERFLNQMTAANCTGFLVAPNLVVTAGHCVKGKTPNTTTCADYHWVFGYEVKKSVSTSASSIDQLATISSKQVYSCKRVVSYALDAATNEDYALVELDRSVTDRKPLALNLKGAPTLGDEIVLMGHPTGLPMKVAAGAQVRALDKNFFYANVDSYGGNSGSPVFNATTYEVEGILVRGNTDYIKDSVNNCYRSNVFAQDYSRPEGVSYISQVVAHLKANIANQ